MCDDYPFKGTKSEIFEKIKKRDFKFPADIDPAAKNLISSLLQLNPIDRLGYGLPGTLTSFKALKEHPFFADVPDNYCFGGRPIPANVREFYETRKEEEMKETLTSTT